MEKKYDIFISYSRKDSAVVEQYSEYLNAAGLSVWIDKKGIETGDEFKRNIVRAIKNSDVFLFFSSVNSNASPWTVKEVNIAVNCKKRIIPIKLDSTPYEESIMFDLAGLNFFDHANNGFETGIEKLLSVFGKDYSMVVEQIKEEVERKQIEEKKYQEELLRQQAAIEAQKHIEEEKKSRIRKEEYKRASGEAPSDNSTNRSRSYKPTLKNPIHRYVYSFFKFLLPNKIDRSSLVKLAIALNLNIVWIVLTSILNPSDLTSKLTSMFSEEDGEWLTLGAFFLLIQLVLAINCVFIYYISIECGSWGKFFKSILGNIFVWFVLVFQISIAFAALLVYCFYDSSYDVWLLQHLMAIALIFGILTTIIPFVLINRLKK